MGVMIELSATNAQFNINLIKQQSKVIFSADPVLADLCAAQAILEAGLRKAPPSILALKYNNLFGIKGHGTDGWINLPTNEYIDGEWEKVVPTNQNFNSNSFAKNVSIKDSLTGYKVLMSNVRYRKVVIAETFEEAAKAVSAAGYATDPHYPQELVDVYNQCLKN